MRDRSQYVEPETGYVSIVQNDLRFIVLMQVTMCDVDDDLMGIERCSHYCDYNSSHHSLLIRLHKLYSLT